jgi:glutaminyl-tRNA synthetase
VDSNKDDIHRLGFEWKNELYASDYFDKLWICGNADQKGLAYVDDSTSEEMAAMKVRRQSPVRIVSIVIEVLMKTWPVARMKAGGLKME